MAVQQLKKDEIIELAKEIIELDLKRDEKFEELTELAGNRAYEILRRVQNACL